MSDRNQVLAATPRRRALLGIGSQGLSSIGNFALVVVMARASDPRSFGAFAVAYSVAWVLHGVVRSFIGETMSVTLSRGGATRAQLAAARDAAGALGLLAGAGLLGLGLIWPDGPLGDWFVRFGFALPLLAVQDAYRFVGFATHRPQIAVRSDAAWLVGQAVGWLSLVALGHADARNLFTVWLLTAGVGVLLVAGEAGKPRLLAAIGWLRQGSRVGASFAAETLIASVADQGAVYAVGLVAGLPAAGALRGAQSLYGPLRSLTLGIRAIALPEAARRSVANDRAQMGRYVARLSTVLGGAAVVALVVYSTLPTSVGRALLDDTWPLARSVMPAVGLSLLGWMVNVGSLVGLRALDANRQALGLKAMTSATGLVLSLAGALLGGLVPAAYGLASAHLLGAAAGAVIYRRALSHERSGSSGG